MIVIDTSAVIAIALQEPEGDDFARRIAVDAAALLPATAYFEASVVLEGRHGAGGRVIFEGLMARLQVIGMRVAPFDASHAERARIAFRVFGKGRHPAALNFGDCLVYATAKTLDAPLLFKGDDFAKTDIEPA